MSELESHDHDPLLNGGHSSPFENPPAPAILPPPVAAPVLPPAIPPVQNIPAPIVPAPQPAATNPPALEPAPATPPPLAAAPAPAPVLPPSIPPVQNIPAPIVVAPQPAKPPVKKPPSKDALTKFKNKNSPEEEARMGFIDHLLELRKRLWITIITIFVFIVVALIFYKQVYLFLTAGINTINHKYQGPAGDEFRLSGIIKAGDNVIQLIATKPLGSMIMVIWLGFWAGLVAASPIALYELWAFVAPGLHEHEKKAIKPVLYGGVFFFLTGAYIAYQYLGPMTMDFFVWLDLTLHVKPFYTSEEYVDLMLTMMVVSGLLCEIPLIVAGLARMSVLEPGWLIKYWKVCTFCSIALGMVVSPGNDLASMSAFSGLILGIYLVSIVMAYIFYKKPYVPGNDKKSGGKSVEKTT